MERAGRTTLRSEIVQKRLRGLTDESVAEIVQCGEPTLPAHFAKTYGSTYGFSNQLAALATAVSANLCSVGSVLK